MKLKELRDSLSLRQKFNVDILWNIGSLAILGMSGVIMNLIIVRYYDSEILGIFNQVFALYTIASQFAVGGVQYSVLKNVSHNQDAPLICSELASAAAVLVCGLSSIISLVLLILATLIGDFLESPGVAFGLRLAAPGLIFFALNKTLLMILNGMRHMRAFAVFQAMRYILIALLVFILIFSNYPGSYLTLSLTIAELLLFISLLLYVNVHMFRLTLSRRISKWFAKHISFGTRGLMSGVFTVIHTRVDMLMLGYFLTDSEVGIYSFAAILAEGIAQLSYVVRRNVDPIIGEYFAKNTLDQISALVHKVRKVFYPIMLFVGVTAVLAYPIILKLFVNKSGFGKSWGIFSILMAGVVISSGYRPFRGIILQGGRPGVHTILTSLLVLTNLILNVILIPLLGIFGAAIATAMAFILENVSLTVSARRLFDIRL